MGSVTNQAVSDATRARVGEGRGELTAAEITGLGTFAASELTEVKEAKGDAAATKWGADFQKKMLALAGRKENAGVQGEIHQMLTKLGLPGLPPTMQQKVGGEKMPAGMTCSAAMMRGTTEGSHPTWGAATAPEGAFVPKARAARPPPPTAPAAPTKPPVDVSKLSADDRKAFTALYKSFGPQMIKMHEKWHSTNGSGGTQGVGSGEKFMQFHANLMKDLGAKISKEAPGLWDRMNKQLPAWDTTKPLPKEFQFAGMDTSMNGPKGINWSPPGYLTTKGVKAGEQGFVLDDGARSTPRQTVAPKTIKSLNDIKSPDELGRVLGTSGAHGVGHVRLGGDMGVYASIGQPAFALWHGKIDSFRTEWQKTASGKAWLELHPSGFIDPNANSHAVAMRGDGPAMRGMAPEAPADPRVERAINDELAELERLQPGSKNPARRP